MILGRTREDKVWRLNKSTYLNMDCAVLEKVLEAATEASTAEVEGLIVEGLEVKKSSLPSSDASFPTPNILLARVVARSKDCFKRLLRYSNGICRSSIGMWIWCICTKSSVLLYFIK